jgi:hypothetical protein
MDKNYIFDVEICKQNKKKKKKLDQMFFII